MVIFEVETLDEGYVFKLNGKRQVILSRKVLIKKITHLIGEDDRDDENKEEDENKSDNIPEPPQKTANPQPHDIVTLDKPCQACNTNSFEHVRHQGNRYGNFNIYRCTKCGMKRNIKDESNNNGESQKTKELRDLAIKMGVQ